MILQWVFLLDSIYLNWLLFNLFFLIIIEVVLNDLLGSDDERLEHSVLKHLEARDISTHTIDLIELEAEVSLLLLLDSISLLRAHRLLYLLVEEAFPLHHGLLALELIELLQSLFRDVDL